MASPAKSTITRFGPYEFDSQTAELRKEGMRVRLEGQPIAILQVLLERPGELVTREELQKKLWPADTFVDFEHSLNAAVKRLRAALNDSADQPRYIATLARRGYRFIATVSGDAPAIATAKPVEDRPEPQVGAPPGSRRLWFGVALVVCALGIAVVSWMQLRQRPPASAVPVIRSLAVLPLENLSGDPSQEYFADGMTDELITDLAQIGSVRVISRTSIMHYKGARKPLPEIARELGVDGIVEGTVVRSEGRVRITSQLISAATDQHLWARSYERDLSDILSLQREIAQAIASEIRATVAPEQRTRMAAAKPVEPEVYESYLRGRFALYRDTPAAVEESIRYFQQAIARDPTFAPAYAGLAGAYLEISTVMIGSTPVEARPKAIAAASKALELDPELAEAHVLLGGAQSRQWQWAEAESEFRRALALNPNSAAGNSELAYWMLSHGRMDEALALARHARELDPLEFRGAEIGFILFTSRRYDEALRELHATLEAQPDQPFALWYMGMVLCTDGKPAEAVPVLEKAVALSHQSPGVTGVLIRAYAQTGRRSDALRLLNELKRRQQSSYVPAAAFVNAYLGLGNNEQAFIWLDQAYKEQSNFLQWLKVHPFFDPLRADSRFRDLLRRTHLED